MKPQWLLFKEKEAAKTGILDLSKEFITDLKLIRPSKTIKVLNLSYSTIESLEGLRKLPNIEKFIANNAAISSLKGFEAISNIRSIELRDTPLSKEKYYKLSIVFAFMNIRTIDNKKIPDSLYKKAETYPEECIDLLNLGWKLEYPCPTHEQLESLRDQTEIINSPVKTTKPKQNDENDSDDFTALVKNVLNRHDKVVEKIDTKLQKLFDSSPDLNEETESVVSVQESEQLQESQVKDQEIISSFAESSISNYQAKPLKEQIVELLQEFGYNPLSLKSKDLLEQIRQILALSAENQSNHDTELEINEEEEEIKEIEVSSPKQQNIPVPVAEEDLLQPEEEEETTQLERETTSPKFEDSIEEETPENAEFKEDQNEEFENENVTYVFGDEEEDGYLEHPNFEEEDFDIDANLEQLNSKISEVNSIIAALTEEEINEDESENESDGQNKDR